MAYEQVSQRFGEFAAARDLSGSALGVASGGVDGYLKFAILVSPTGAVPASTTLRPDWQVDVATGPTVRTMGVIQNRPEITEGVTLYCSGMVMVRAGGVIAAGQDVMCDATARAVVLDTSNVANLRQGRALEGATAADQVITILLREQF